MTAISLASRTRSGIALLLPLVAACAAPRAASHAVASPAASTRVVDRPDQLLSVSLAGTSGSVVLAGAPVELLAGGRAQRGDTLYATAPFVVALPDEAFALQVSTRAAARSDVQVRFATTGAAGELATVRAEGRHFTVRRDFAGGPLRVEGATHRVESTVRVASAR